MSKKALSLTDPESTSQDTQTQSTLFELFEEFINSFIYSVVFPAPVGYCYQGEKDFSLGLTRLSSLSYTIIERQRNLKGKDRP